MIAWGEFRDIIRRSILLDDFASEADRRWTDLELRDSIWWALSTFAGHTAVATATSFAGDDATTVFPMPDNVFDDLQQTALVYLVKGSIISYLDPIFFTPGLNPTASAGWYTLPDTTVNVVVAPVTGQTLYVRYFAAYNRPYADDNLLSIPQWAEVAVAHLAGAYALTQKTTAETNIDQYKRAPEKGDPTDNAYIVMQRHLLQIYDREIARFPVQRRTQHFRELSR